MKTSKEKRLRSLIGYLRKSAEKDKTQAIKEECEFTRGHYSGYASAYELCAEWIEEIFQG